MMPFSRPDWRSESRTSNTYLSFTDQDLSSVINSADPLFCEKLRSEMESNSLGSPNATLGHPGTYPSGQEEEANARYLATYMKAFALVYVLPEVDWTAEKIDMLLGEGTDLFPASSELEQPDDGDQKENKNLQPEIHTDEKRIVRKFNLEGHTLTLALEPRYRVKAAKPLMPHLTCTMRNLKRILQSFFLSCQYCLLLTRVGNLLVWRRKQVFFVLDVKGTRRNDLQSGKDKGVVMLKCLRTIDKVVHLASNLRGMRPKDEFTIRELVVVRLETPDGRNYMRDSSRRSMEFQIVDKSYAYLKATLHLPLNKHDPVKNRSSLMVAVGSILASKVHHPANWDTNMLDHLVCYGVGLCRSCWSDCLRDQRPIDLDTFPTQLRLGQFVLELKLIPNVKAGHWKSGVCIIGTDFAAHVREAFKKYSNVVFQINNQMYAMWAKDDFYYLLDPYQHSVVGTHSAEDKGKGAKWATVRMFRDQLTLLSVFHQLLQESNGQSAYYLHVVRIRNLAECPKGFALAPLPEDVDTLDVESLNEPVLFGDQPGVREWDKFLKEISEYEDEEMLKNLKERQNAGAMVSKPLRKLTRGLSKKNLIPPTKTCKPKTRCLKKAAPKKPCQNAKPSTSKIQILKLLNEKKSPNVYKSSIVVPESLKKKRSTRRIKGKVVQVPKKPAISVVSSIFSRQAGGRVSDHSLCPGKVPNQPIKWSAKELAIIKLGHNLIMQRGASLKESEPRTLPGEGNSKTPKCSPTKQSESVSQKSNSLGVAAAAPTSEATPGPCEFARETKSMSRFPGFNREPQLLAVAGSESGTVESLNRVLGSSFKVADRVLAMTPWGNYMIFRHPPKCSTESAAPWFYLFDGCTCDIDRFRHMDLSRGTAGLVAFQNLLEVVCYLIDLREKKALKMLRTRVKEEEPLQRYSLHDITSCQLADHP